MLKWLKRGDAMFKTKIKPSGVQNNGWSRGSWTDSPQPCFTNCTAALFSRPLLFWMDSSWLPGQQKHTLNVGPPAPGPGPAAAPSYTWSCGFLARRAGSGGSPRRPAAGSTPGRRPSPSSPCRFHRDCNTKPPFHRPPLGTRTTNWSVLR